MRVAVVGCGLVGAAVARELALRGAGVVVYEATRPGQGTSGTTFAWVNAFDKEPRAYHDLNLAGVRAHHALQEQGGGGRWFVPTGNLVWADGPEGETRLARIAARLEGWDYPLKRLTPASVRELEPDLHVPDQVGEVLFLPLEGHVLPAVLLARLLGEARDRGAELRCPARVVDVTPASPGVEIRLDDGSTEIFDAAVSCVGRWTAELLDGCGHPVPMADPDLAGSVTVGFLAYTAPVPVRLERVVTSPRLNVRPDGGGRLVLQGLDLDVAADPAVPVAPDRPIARELVSRLGALLPGAAGAALEGVRVGQRAMPADGLTVAGHVDDAGRLYVVATHSGVTLAPFLARVAAGEILDGERADVLGPFRPQRLAGG